jgi:hypothetical protein
MNGNGGIMARRDIPMNEVVETIYQWHQGRKIQQISKSLGLDRKTVRKYLGMVEELSIDRERPLPDEQELIRKLRDLMNTQSVTYERPALDLVAQYRDEIERWFDDSRMTAKQVWRLLKENHKIAVGYSTVKRYVKKEFPRERPQVTVRIETSAGDEAQVDFGYAGLMYDPETQRKRKTWAFIMTLSFSRHRFVRFVFHQDIPTWLDCHERAFEWFGGVPSRITLDNLKSGVVKADIYDPLVNYAYADLERHYGFVADPAKMGDPEQKGKVERSVAIVKKHLLAGALWISMKPTSGPSTGARRRSVRRSMGPQRQSPTPSSLPKRGPGSKPCPLWLSNVPCGSSARSIPTTILSSRSLITHYPPDTSEKRYGPRGPTKRWRSSLIRSGSSFIHGHPVRERG